MTKQFFKDAFLWGFFLWLIGYILGIVLFALVPHSLLGWVIMPIGIALTLWVLWKKVTVDSLSSYFLLATIWLLIALICDYLFLVQVFKPTDGYYKLDVYIYYVLTFALPIMVGLFKNSQKKL